MKSIPGGPIPKEEPESNSRVPIRRGALIALEIRPRPATLWHLSPRDDIAALIRHALHRLFSFPWGRPCFLALLLASPASAGLVHRWSFNEAAGSAARGTVLTDPISDAEAVVRGNGATLTGTTLVLPGTTDGNQGDTHISAYIDLPNGVISSKTNLTVEIWAAPLGSRSWQRLFEFGRTAGPGDGQGAPGEWTGTAGTGPASNQTGADTFLATFQIGPEIGQQQLAFSPDGITGNALNVTVPSTLGTRYHTVVTFADGSGAFGKDGGRFTWYRDGQQVGSLDLPIHLRDLADVNNWLGRSQGSADPLANAAYDEVRIYDHALTPAEVSASRDAGPDAALVVTRPDNITMHRLQKVRVAALANDRGPFDPATVSIVQKPRSGTALPAADGTILYSHTGGVVASDRFTYRVRSAAGDSVPATVNITFSNSLRIPRHGVNLPNTAPVAAGSVQLVNAFPGVTFEQPVAIASPPGETQRLFVVEREAKIKLVADVTAPTPAASVFLDLQAMLAARGQGETIDAGINGEFGLLGLAFHPSYAQNRQFFIFYSVNIAGTHYERLSRMTARADNANLADTSSELILIDQLDREPNHNGGDLHFGPDGYLYVSLGDEGGQYDVRQNSQRIDLNFFSGLLRIDVDKQPGSLDPNPHPAVPLDNGVARFAVPPGNPFIGASSFNGAAVDPAQVRTEFWAVGLRNPWRFSFDPLNGDLWLGDVGQDSYEEINLITKGGNYGWAAREGTHAGPRIPPASFSSIDPEFEYPHLHLSGNLHDKGNAVTGGIVSRGGRFPEFEGAYFFADWQSGNIWKLLRGTPHPTVERIAGEGGIVAFGRDPSNQDILLADYDGQRLLRLTIAATHSEFPQTLGATGLFADLKDLSPTPGLISYTPNLSFWSDYAIKRRWFSLPDTTSRMTWSRDGAWTFPSGMLWVKHFDLETTRGVPATRKRIETRVLLRNDEGVFGVSYRWNDAGTEAMLVSEAGEDFDLPINVKGVPQTQHWHIPSRSECTTCHNATAGYGLSFSTRQLNRATNMRGFSGNQLDLLRTHGFFTNAPDPASRLPRHVRPDETAFSVEARVRSYLSVNCSYCHLPGGSAPPTWDARSLLTLAQTGLIDGHPANNQGDPANRLVAPGDPQHTILLSRITGTGGVSRMPPLGSSELDPSAITLLTHWVQHPAAATSASFNGLIRGDPVAAANVGFVKLTVSAKQSFSISGQLGGQAFARTGAFDTAGHAEVLLSAAGKPPLKAMLTLNATRDLVTGELQLEGGTIAALSADRVPAYPAPERSPWEGRYTVAIPGAPASAWDTLPAGCGYGTGVVSAAGAVRFAGTLGDSTTGSQSARLSALGGWPFHLGLYGAKGALNGMLTFRDFPGSSDLDGTLDWFKPADPKALFYPGGFDVKLDAFGSRFTGLPLGFTAATLTLEGGAVVPSTATTQLSVDAAAHFTPLNSPGFKLTLAPATGLFTGQFREGNSTLLRAFGGAFLQKTGEGYGLFKGKERQTGAVELNATAP